MEMSVGIGMMNRTLNALVTRTNGLIAENKILNSKIGDLQKTQDITQTDNYLPEIGIVEDVTSPTQIYNLAIADSGSYQVNHINDSWNSQTPIHGPISIDSCGTRTVVGTTGGVMLYNEKTWSTISGLTKSCTSICVSEDKIGVCSTGDYVYIYDGTSWTTHTPAGAGETRSWNHITCSDDGTKFAVSVSGGYIYLYNGTAWTEQTAIGEMSWTGLKYSGDGSKLIASATSGYIHVYTTYWYELSTDTSAGTYAAIDINNDGSIIVGCKYTGYIYKYYNSVWYQLSPTGTTGLWADIAIYDSTISVVAGSQIVYHYNTSWTVDNTGLEVNLARITRSSNNVFAISDVIVYRTMDTYNNALGTLSGSNVIVSSDSTATFNNGTLTITGHDVTLRNLIFIGDASIILTGYNVTFYNCEFTSSTTPLITIGIASSGTKILNSTFHLNNTSAQTAFSCLSIQNVIFDSNTITTTQSEYTPGTFIIAPAGLVASGYLRCSNTVMNIKSILKFIDLSPVTSISSLISMYLSGNKIYTRDGFIVLNVTTNLKSIHIYNDYNYAYIPSSSYGSIGYIYLGSAIDIPKIYIINPHTSKPFRTGYYDVSLEENYTVSSTTDLGSTVRTIVTSGFTTNGNTVSYGDAWTEGSIYATGTISAPNIEAITTNTSAITYSDGTTSIESVKPIANGVQTLMSAPSICYGLCSSVDGTSIYSVQTSSVHHSSDGGATWTMQYTSNGLRKIVCSANGQYAYAIGTDDTTYSIYRNNGSDKWSVNATLAASPVGITCSGTGEIVYYITATAGYVSTNYGGTFAEMTTLTTLIGGTSITCSYDGARIYIGETAGIIYSLNSGTDWLTNTTIINIIAISSSHVGNVVVACSSSNYGLSTNAMTTISSVAPATSITTVACSRIESETGFSILIVGSGYILASDDTLATNTETVITDVSNYATCQSVQKYFVGGSRCVQRSTDLSTWTILSVNQVVIAFDSIACSGDGDSVFATFTGTRPYYSTDKVSWMQSPAIGDGYYIASDTTGTNIVSVKTTGEYYYSTDGAETWTTGTALTGTISSIAIDSTGANVCVGTDSDVYYGVTAGTSWTASGSAIISHSIKFYGTSIMVSDASSHIWISLTPYTTWTSSTVTASLLHLAISATGSVIYGTTSTATNYYSIDSGTTWNTFTSTGVVNSITCTGDGSLVFIAVDTGIYYSFDYGANVVLLETVSSHIYNIACSLTGTTLYVRTGTFIYSYTVTLSELGLSISMTHTYDTTGATSLLEVGNANSVGTVITRNATTSSVTIGATDNGYGIATPLLYVNDVPITGSMTVLHRTKYIGDIKVCRYCETTGIMYHEHPTPSDAMTKIKQTTMLRSEVLGVITKIFDNSDDCIFATHGDILIEDNDVSPLVGDILRPTGTGTGTKANDSEIMFMLQTGIPLCKVTSINTGISGYVAAMLQ
jgi:hypothetical protein